ncbi:MAG: ubiquinol-cytochrome c reductase iron-sulfur subunit [Acidobacteriota bacterium]
MSEPTEEQKTPVHDSALPADSVPEVWRPTARERDAARASASSRRTFLFKLALGLNGLVGVVFAVPILGYLLGPVLKKKDGYNSWVKLGTVDTFPKGETRLAEYINPVTSPSDGATAKTACWVRRTEDGQFQVFAINCAHLGCPVRWFAQSQLFLCPCHGGAYYADGSRASGPPPRGLFEYEHRVEDDALMIFAGQLPTLSTEACRGKGPLEQNNPASTAQAKDGGSPAASETRRSTWQA